MSSVVKIPSDTIAAISTPPGSGGIGIVRLSGPDAVIILRKLFVPRRPKGENPDEFPRSHRLYYGTIVDPVQGETVDEVMVGFMKAPRSYTREDVVEINAHAGTAVLRTLLQLCIAHGARLAEAGEFTKRAFLSGRIDLSQAEAVADVIQARTDQALRHASAQLLGGLRDRMEGIRQSLVAVSATIEAFIDFPDDMESEIDPDTVKETLLREVLQPLERTAQAYEKGRVYRDGVQCMIAGRPNVGKSSLMNRLLDRERVIVTDVPGTTRDIVEDVFHVDGAPVIIMDSAGIQDSRDPVERIGIERTRSRFDSCDLILMVTDASQGVTSADRDLYQCLRHKDPLIVVNKMDLLPETRKNASSTPWPEGCEVYISAKYDQGIPRLHQAIAKRIFDDAEGLDGERVLPNLRQKEGIERAATGVRRAMACFDGSGNAFELAAIDLAEARKAVDEVLGLKAGDDVLDQIFSRFCIGK